jgi:predicted DNA-binding transcriptional regulator YafY
VGGDGDADDIRVFALARVEALEVTEDTFERPERFAVRDWVSLPFELGEDEPQDVTLVIPASLAERAEALTLGKGEVSARNDGGLDWRVAYRDRDALSTFILERHIGFGEEASAQRAFTRAGLEAVVSAHA